MKKMKNQHQRFQELLNFHKNAEQKNSIEFCFVNIHNLKYEEYDDILDLRTIEEYDMGREGRWHN